MSRYNVFQYEIPDRVSYERTLYDHFENFRKIKFQWLRIFEKTLAFCEFLLDFQLKNGPQHTLFFPFCIVSLLSLMAMINFREKCEL